MGTNKILTHPADSLRGASSAVASEPPPVGCRGKCVDCHASLSQAPPRLSTLRHVSIYSSLRPPKGRRRYDPPPVSDDVRTQATTLLDRAGTGDPRALTDLFPVVYDELRRMAAGLMARERPSHTLQPTALAHEAYVRLVDESRLRWQGRAQFFALVARAMRRILVEHARARGTAKRGGGAHRVALEVEDPRSAPATLDVLDLESALTELAAVDPRGATVVELRYFGGMGTADTAAALGVSPRSVEEDWSMARAWLKVRLGR